MASYLVKHRNNFTCLHPLLVKQRLGPIQDPFPLAESWPCVSLRYVTALSTMSQCRQRQVNLKRQVNLFSL